MTGKFNRVSTTPERLKEAMAASGKKQIDLVRATGLDKGSISHYLSGRYEPKQEAIYKLALALDVSEMWLWGYDVPMERSQAQKNNDVLADIIIELRTDSDFRALVESLYILDPSKRKSVKDMLCALTQ